MNFSKALQLLSKNAKQVGPFIAMDILEKSQVLARAGHDIISLSIGEPDFPAPPVAKAATMMAIKNNLTRYTHSLGNPNLREEICAHYKKRYRVQIHPDQVLVTSGTSPAMLILFGILLNPKDEIIMSDPHYPCYPNFIRFFGGKIQWVKAKEQEGFQLNPEKVRKKISKKTKGIFINSPSNPTGCTLSSEVMKKLADTGSYIISDEIYHGLTYEGEERSILEFTDRAFVLNGFSKSYSMTGFRLGYCIFPKPFIRVIQNLAQNFYISTSSFIQEAGIAALKFGGPYQDKIRKRFNQRRKIMLEEVRALGFQVATEPTGAFYVFANAKRFTKDSYRFAFDLLEKTKVGVTPGIDFGPSGEGFIRFSYATDDKRIREGLGRIGEYLRKKKLL